MKTIILALFLGLSAFVSAQNCQVGNSCNGTISASDGGTCTTANACISLPLSQNTGTAGLSLGGTFTATLQFEASADNGATWVSISGAPLGSTTLATSATAAGAWRFGVSGLTNIRVRSSSYGSGSVIVTFQASPTAASLGGAGSVTHTLGNLTASKCVIGNGLADISVDPNCSLDGAGNLSIVSVFSATANPSVSGVFRAAATDNGLCFRNAANNGDICISKTAGDLFNFNAGAQFGNGSTGQVGTYSLLFNETTAPACGANIDVLYGDSTTHTIKYCLNNGSLLTLGSALNVNAVAVNSPNLANNFQVLGSNIYWTNTPQFVTGFGDSITAGSTGVTGSNQSYFDLITSRTGGGATNYAISGAQAADVAKLQVIANTQTMPAPPLVAGNLATSTSGGSLIAATSDCVKITYNTVLGESTPSPEACITTGAGSSNSVTVTAPIPTNGQAGFLTGYTVYSGLTTAELKQAASGNCVNISIGTNCVIQVLGAGAAPPGTNTAYLPNTTEDNLTLAMVGTNDVTQYGATASLQTVFKQTLDTSIVWSSSATPVFAQGSSCVGTGAWSNDNTGLSGLGTQSTTNGNTLACSNIQVNNGVLYVIYRIINSDGGTFTVKDGTTVLTDQITNASTLNGFPGASMTTLNGTTDSFATARFTGLSNGLHTINFTVTSATNAANVVSISALATVPGVTYATPERIYVGGVIKQQSDANSALTDAYNTLVKNQVSALATDGLLVYFADVRSYVNSTSDMFNSLHPNNTGQAHLRDAFAAQIQYPMMNDYYELCFGQLTPQVTGTDSCIYRSNPQTWSFGNLTRSDTSGILRASDYQVFNGANKTQELNTVGLVVAANGLVSWSNSNTSLGTVDLRLTRGAAGILQVGTASAGTTGFVKSSQINQVITSNYTTSSTTLAAAGVVTGLSFTTPTSFSSNWSFECNLTYSQATAAAADLFGITTTGTAPTSMLANATVLTSNANAGINGSAIITTATSTTVATATPSAFGAIGTVADMFQVHLSGTIEAPNNASPSIVGISVATGNASDALTIYRGSYCNWY